MSPPPSPPAATRILLALACLALTIAVLPRWAAGRQADALFDGNLNTQDALAHTVSTTVLPKTDHLFYNTGQARFDGQSAIAIYQMALLGLGQTILAHPEKRDAYLPAMEAAANALVDPKTLTYATQVYGVHATQRMDPGQGHAYAGYINMGLGMLRLIEPHTHLATLHDRLTADLRARLFDSATGLIETYPGESWPPDVAVVAASIGLHAAATGLDIHADLDAWSQRFAACAIHSPSGYLYQRLETGTCKPVDAPRGSGTAFAAYTLGFATPALSKRLYQALAGDGRISFVGFAGIREYADGFQGYGDTNAGPILFGASVGATGFGLGAARMNGDRDLFTALYRSTHVAGLPMEGDQGSRFGAGGALGNALLLAMLTARSP